MRLVAALRGDLVKVMDAELRAAARAVTGGIREAGGALRDDLRGRVRAAGYQGGARLERAWRANTYPAGGRDSLGAAALVYSKAERIHALMAEGGTLRAGGDGWRVIPLPEAIRRGWDETTGQARGDDQSRTRRRSNVEAAIRAMGALRFVRIGPGKALLVADNLTAGLRRSKVRRRKDGSTYQAVGRASAPLFLLVKVTRHARRFDIGQAVEAANRQLAGRIVRHWGQAA